MKDFLIKNFEGDFHSLSIKWSSDKSCIYFHSNGGTKTIDKEMAEQILRGLMAILRGGFDRAISEVALEAEARSQRGPITASMTTVLPSRDLKPELDIL